MSSFTPKPPILVVDLKTQKSILLKDLILLKGASNYTILIENKRQDLLMAHTLSHYEALLPSNDFLRLHRSFLVNKAHIICFNLTEATVLLSDGNEIKVARRLR